MSSTLFLNGTVGAGKTSTAFAVGDRLREHGIPHQVIDLDGLRQAWPAPPDDRFNHRLEVNNLGSMARNARAAGVRVLVLAGVIEDAAGRADYERVLGRMSVVRLTARSETVRQRLLLRHDPGEERDWHLARADELAAIIADAEVDDRIVVTDARAISEVADEIARAFVAEAGQVDVGWHPGEERAGAGHGAT
jgi:ATPase involved in DNA replication initiation